MDGIIYKATNWQTGKSYIGLTTQGLQKRIISHYSSARRNKQSYFYSSIRKHGEDSFDWKIIDCCKNENDLKRAEKFHIARWNTKAPNGYNLTDGGDGLLNPPKFIKQKRSKLFKGKNNPMFGKKHSKKTKEKIAEKRIGRTSTDEERFKSSKGREGRGLFGFSGTSYRNKHILPGGKVWFASIQWKGKSTSLGYYNDPFSAELVYKLVKKELYKGVGE